MATKRRAISTVLKGVTFEQRSVGILRDHLSMSLRRVGGKGDGGIDLQGWWWLPSHCLAHTRSKDVQRTPEEASDRTPLRVLGQCKAEEKKIGPRYIREFEGVVLRHSAYLATNESGGPVTSRLRSVVVGLFVSASPFTKASILEAYSSPIPLALMHLPEPSDPSESNQVPEVELPGTLVFNPALSGENAKVGVSRAGYQKLAEMQDPGSDVCIWKTFGCYRYTCPRNYNVSFPPDLRITQTCLPTSIGSKRMSRTIGRFPKHARLEPTFVGCGGRRSHEVHHMAENV